MAPAVHAADGAVLQVVGARDPGRARALEPVRAVPSYADVCAADDVDAVYVALPNADHLPWVEEALAAGKHVLCEKPLGRSADEVARMAHAAARADRLLVEAAWNRWHPRTRRAEWLVADLPGPRRAMAWFTFPGVPRDNYRLDPGRGGGALLDVGPYVVAAAHWALGAGQVSVVEATRRLGPTGVDLTTTAVLAGREGRAHVTASFERADSQGLRIESPGLTIELPDEAFTSWRTGSTLRVTRGPAVDEELFPPCDAYRVMIEAVSARIGGGDAWVLPLAVSRAVASILDAVALRAAAASSPPGPGR
jgi:predicted dehydrogenase